MKVTEHEPRLSTESRIVEVEVVDGQDEKTYRFSVEGSTAIAEEVSVGSSGVNTKPAVHNRVVEKLLRDEGFDKVCNGKGEVIGTLEVDGQEW